MCRHLARPRPRYVRSNNRRKSKRLEVRGHSFLYVRYEKITRNPIEGEAPWIAQAIGPNLAQAASADERIIRRHTVVAIRSSLPNQVSRFWPLPFGSPQQPPAPNEVYELLSPGTSRHTSTCLCMAHLGFAIETFAFVFTGGKTSGCEKPAGVSGAFEVAVAVAFGALVTRIPIAARAAPTTSANKALRHISLD